MVRKNKSRSESAVGTLTMNPGGFGFVRRADPEEEENVFIPPGRMGGALDGDEVLIRCRPSEKGYEGAIEEVITRKRNRLVGSIEKRGGGKFVLVPDDPRVRHRVDFVRQRGGDSLAQYGDRLVSARIVDYPNQSDEPIRVQFERELGEPGRLDTEIRKILIEQEVEDGFPDEVLAEAKDLAAEVRKSDLDGRADLRHLPFMTIDPPDARDFDDAVAVECLGEDPMLAEHRVWVAVADVSHYVREGSAVDTWAAEQCFSTYLPHRAIPMLPPEWSSNICSLVPKQDRLAMVASMVVDPAGEVREVEVMAAVIHSRERLTYDQAATVLSEKAKSKLPQEIQERVRALRQVADWLRAARLRRGAIELSLPESKILLDEDDRMRIRDVRLSRSNPEMVRAYNLIEEFMLAANEAMARLAMEAKLPAVFRVHDKPSEDKLKELAAAAESLGVKTDHEKLQRPRGAQKFLSKVASRPQAQALNMLMLRAMSQAEYRTENIEHFALSSGAYLHFTSPIRRYPDLIVHRVMKAHLAYKKANQEEGDPEFFPGPRPYPRMPKPDRSASLSDRSCTRERSIASAEREVKSLFAAAFMQDRVGDRFEGKVSGISPFGVFVQLEDPYVDGMIKYQDFEKEWGEGVERDETGIRLVGQNSGRMITVGDSLVVDVETVSMARRQIDFALVSVLSR